MCYVLRVFWFWGVFIGRCVCVGCFCGGVVGYWFSVVSFVVRVDLVEGSVSFLVFFGL